MPAGDLKLAHLIGVGGFEAFVTYADDSDWVVAETLSYPKHPGLDLALALLLPRHFCTLFRREDSATVVFSDPVSKAMLALVQRVTQVDVTALLSGPGSG